MDRLLALAGDQVVHGGTDPSFGRDRLYELAGAYLQATSSTLQSSGLPRQPSNI